MTFSKRSKTQIQTFNPHTLSPPYFFTGVVKPYNESVLKCSGSMLTFFIIQFLLLPAARLQNLIIRKYRLIIPIIILHYHVLLSSFEVLWHSFMTFCILLILNIVQPGNKISRNFSGSSAILSLLTHGTHVIQNMFRIAYVCILNCPSVNFLMDLYITTKLSCYKYFKGKILIWTEN